MEETIFDGEPHALSESYGYIAQRIHEDQTEQVLHDYVNKELVKYANYLYENDKDKVIDYLMEIFRAHVFHNSTPEDYQLIFRPPHIVSSLAQYSTLCLKFKRAPKDNLYSKEVQNA